MVAWVVNDRLHPRRTPPSSFLLPPSSFPWPHSHFGTHPTLVPQKIAPFFSCAYVEPILQPLCFQIHACNGGCTALLDVQTFKRLGVSSIYPLSFQFFRDTPTQRPLTNPFAIKSLRTLFIATEGVPPPSIFFSPPPTARAPQVLAPASREALP